jgi:hypothetical protein
MVPIGTDTVSKAQVAEPESKREQGKRGRKIFNVRSTHHHKRGGDQRPLKQSMATKIEDNTTPA